jgi:hypothetical protein
MKRKDKHINKFLRDPLPDPEIPADDAWAGMSDMLDAAEDHGATGEGRLSRIWKSMGKFKGLLIGVLMVLTSAAVLLIILNAETKDQKSIEIQPVSSKIQDSALAKTDVKTPVSRPDTNHFNIATAPSETTSPKAAGAPGPITSTDPVISENRRIEVKSKHSPTVAANSGRTRTRTARAGITGIRNTNTPASALAKGRGTFFSAANRQNEAAAPTNPLGTGHAAQETVTSISLEKNSNAATARTSLNNLEPLAGHFESGNNDLSKLVKKPNVASQPASVKARSSVWRGINFGPEWNINRSIVSTDYMFTGADSIKHPARLAIPGLFVSKTWKRHTATFIFSPLHSYFGDKVRVAQRTDSIPGTDSIFYKVDRNTNFLKAFGLNFSLQYQYRIVSLFSLVGGFSYARYSAALLRQEIEYPNGEIITGGYLTAKGQEALKSYIRPQQWNIRAGILFHSPSVFNNRLQFAWMTTIPISNLSLNGFKSVKSPNMQVSLRFLVR